MKELENYNLVKAIKEARDNKLTGLELEMHQENERACRNLQLPVSANLGIPDMVVERLFSRANEMTTILGSTYGHSSVGVYDEPFKLMPDYEKWGATVLRDLKTITEIPKTTSSGFAKVLEGASTPQVVTYDDKEELSPIRFQGYNYYSNEYLSETAAVKLLIGNAINLINREISRDLLYKASIQGYTPAGVEPTSFKEIMDTIGKSQGVINPAFVTSTDFYDTILDIERGTGNGYKLTPLDYMFGRIYGVKTFGTDLITEDESQTIIFADWAKTYVGLFGGLNILVNPFARGDEGYTKLTFTKFADTGVSVGTTIYINKDTSGA